MKALYKGFLVFSLSIFSVNNTYSKCNVLDGLIPGDSLFLLLEDKKKFNLRKERYYMF